MSRQRPYDEIESILDDLSGTSNPSLKGVSLESPEVAIPVGVIVPDEEIVLNVILDDDDAVIEKCSFNLPTTPRKSLKSVETLVRTRLSVSTESLFDFRYGLEGERVVGSVFLVTLKNPISYLKAASRRKLADARRHPVDQLIS